MRRAQKWLVSIALAVSALGATTQGAYAHQGDAWSNSDAFRPACIGVTDTYPSRLYTLARNQMALLGYSPIGGSIGAAFTRADFLDAVFYDYGVYVHSHGDNYWAAGGYPNVDSGFLQDPGPSRCNDYTRDTVRSSSIKTETMGTPYNLVIMSTCDLGASTTTMPDAFQIEKTKSSTQHEFFMSYATATYDSTQLRFESAFWSYLNGVANHTRTVYQAFTYAAGLGGYEIPSSADPFSPNWWGNPSYNGVPG